MAAAFGFNIVAIPISAAADSTATAHSARPEVVTVNSACFLMYYVNRNRRNAIQKAIVFISSKVSSTYDIIFLAQNAKSL